MTWLIMLEPTRKGQRWLSSRPRLSSPGKASANTTTLPCTPALNLSEGKLISDSGN